MLKTRPNTVFFKRLPIISLIAASLAGAISLRAEPPVLVPSVAEEYSKAPVIVDSPRSVSVRIGEDALFSVTATGDALDYKWFVNDTLQNNVNVKNVRIAKVKQEFNGTRIYAVVSNPYGASTSKEAILTVDTNDPSLPAIISFSAVPESIKPGQKTRLEAVYSGGQGIVTPGSFTLVNNHFVEVCPPNSTTYNLTVTGANGQKAVANVSVKVLGRTLNGLEENPMTGKE